MNYLVLYLSVIRDMQRDLNLPPHYFRRPSNNDPQWNPSTEESEIVRWVTAKLARDERKFRFSHCKLGIRSEPDIEDRSYFGKRRMAEKRQAELQYRRRSVRQILQGIRLAAFRERIAP
jgi:hypothetical protein